MSRAPQPTKSPRERIFCCGVLLPDHPREYGGFLAEARSLVEAAGALVVGADDLVYQRRQRPDASTMMGSGKVAEVREATRRHAADAVMVDNDLSPGQIRNLEKAWGVRVIDRSELILDIFASRARTKQAALQVELAQMEYLRPRLRRMWTHLERTEGAIGTRGPGETQLETDRRLIAKRIRDLKARLAEIERRKRRQVRSRSDVFTLGLLGYTNAGKSTLLNQLTGADVFAADMPFATLDTRTRQWRLSDGRVVLVSDTVGFLQRLPHHLVASFHATLEEALNVDLMIHVVDASHPDAAIQMAAVEKTLASLTNRRADMLVLNKVDRVREPLRLHLLVEGHGEEVVHLSARTGEGIERFEHAVCQRLDARSALVEVSLSLADGRAAALFKAGGVVVSEEVRGDELVLRLRITEGALGNVRRALREEVVITVLEKAAEPFLREELSA